MGREIKFRAWDKVLKAMVDWDGIHSTSIPYLLSAEYEVMQYTGLKDKNGVEIYEGDVIDAFYIDDHPNLDMAGTYLWTGPVHYEQSLCTYQIKSHYNGVGFLAQISKSNCKNYVVQGNIYANPELLEEANG
jgi:uncharacterized phage protein (TIGR01671 family)